MTDLTQKTILITGATSGIGLETAVALSKQSTRLLLPCRNLVRGEEVRDRISKEAPNVDVSLYALDLASLDSVRAFANVINAEEGHLDTLINNAGTMPMRYQQTEDGFEMMFGVNYLAHFLLTLLLLEKIKAAPQGRIVHVSSTMHRSGRIDLSSIRKPRRYFWSKSYGQSKLANVLFSNELARRLSSTSVTSNALHPGIVGTNIVRGLPKWMQKAMPYISLTPAQGAVASIDLASNPAYSQTTGAYSNKGHIGLSSARSRDPQLAKSLWDESMRLCDLAEMP